MSVFISAVCIFTSDFKFPRVEVNYPLFFISCSTFSPHFKFGFHFWGNQKLVYHPPFACFSLFSFFHFPFHIPFFPYLLCIFPLPADFPFYLSLLLMKGSCQHATEFSKPLVLSFIGIHIRVSLVMLAKTFFTVLSRWAFDVVGLQLLIDTGEAE